MLNETKDDSPGSTQSSRSSPWGRRLLISLGIIAGLVAFVLIVRHNQGTSSDGPPGMGRRMGGPGGQRGGGPPPEGPGGGPPGGPGGFNQPVAVSIGTVTRGDIDVRIPGLGTVTPLATVTVKAQISGQLQKIAFTEGQIVHKGDFLAQVDPRPYQAALDSAIGTLKKDQALLENARIDLKRYKDLVAQDSVAEQTLATQRSLVDQYIGTVETDEATIETDKVNLIYCHITAPVTGRVGLRQVDQGNYVTSGDTNGIVIITELDPITVVFPIPEDYVNGVAQRLFQAKTLPTEVFDRTNSKKLSEGKLVTLDNQIDTTTGTVKLRALFDNKDGSLFPNQFVNVQLLENTLHDQTIMPSSAVHRGAPGGTVSTFVYRVDTANSTVSVRTVTLGAADGERVAVTDGLSPGDVVVTEGGDRLRDGAQVTLPNAQPVQAAGTGPNGPAGNRPNNGNGSGRHRKNGRPNAGPPPGNGAPPAGAGGPGR